MTQCVTLPQGACAQRTGDARGYPLLFPASISDAGHALLRHEDSGRLSAAHHRPCTPAELSDSRHSPAPCLSALGTVLSGHHVHIQLGDNVDNIIVLRHGRIAEQGTHASLIAACGYYATLVKRTGIERSPDAIKVSGLMFCCQGNYLPSFMRRFLSISWVMASRSYSGFQSHSARAQESSRLLGQESAMAWRSGSCS